MAKMIKNKDAHLKSDEGFFAQGGHTKMFGKGNSFPAEDSVSGKSANAKGPTGEGHFLDGGHTKMFGKGHANFKVPGISGKESN